MLMELSIIFILCSIPSTLSIPGQFFVTYNGTVTSQNPVTYIYKLPNPKNVIRASVSARNVSEAFPVLVVFKQQMNVMSFRIPLLLDNRKHVQTFSKVSRTLCPSDVSFNSTGQSEENILVELSTSKSDLKIPSLYSLKLVIEENFILNFNNKVNVIVTSAEPQYFFFNFPENVESVVIKARSSDKLCMILSVQPAKCPVADLIGNVKYSGIYQTVTTLGTMTITKSQFRSQFFIVLVLKSDDVDCGGSLDFTPNNSNHSKVPHIPRSKNVTLTVVNTLNGQRYLLPILGAIGTYLLFYIAAGVIVFVYQAYDNSVRIRYGSQSSDSTVPLFFPIDLHAADSHNQNELTGLSRPSVGDSAIQRIRRHVDSKAVLASTCVDPIQIQGSYAAVHNPNQGTGHRSVFSGVRSVPRSLFSSSSDDEEYPIRFIKPSRVKKVDVPTAKPVFADSNPPVHKSTHRRSVSYGSTREMSKLRHVTDKLANSSHVNMAFERNTIAELSQNVSVGKLMTPVPKSDDDIDRLSDIKTDRQVYLQNRYLYVSDLARKRYSTLNRKYLLYFWYLIIISIFYGLPVIQLVMTYQRALHDTGNEDMCYYNFECAHPLGVFTAVNNIISNVGYVMLGLLFLGLTAHRDILHRNTFKHKIAYKQSFCSWLFSSSNSNRCRECGCKYFRGISRVSQLASINSQNIVQQSPTIIYSASPTENFSENKNNIEIEAAQLHIRPNMSLHVRSTNGGRSFCKWFSCLTNMLCFNQLVKRCRCHRRSMYETRQTQSTSGNIVHKSENTTVGQSAYQKRSIPIEEEISDSYKMKFGIPQHYGLFYAMGFSLTMEGVLSACYHICPSFSNFQFDTAYMYILALILMLKIYQTRHPDINASAHSAYMMIALTILLGVVGVLYGGETFWVIFTIVFIIVSIWMTAEIYYMGQWNLDLCLPRRLYFMMRSDGITCLIPMYRERMLLLLVANCVNIAIATFGLITRPNDFSSFLLTIFMINLLMYFVFYNMMKLRHRERFHCVPLVYILAACMTWISALYFFIQHSATWELSPAQSRALNQPCILLDFYDVHDVWHFLSSASMFFSFMLIMSLDDDLVNTPRHEIPVF